MTEMGVPLPGSAGDSIANAVDPNEVYEIDKVLRATKVGGKYLIWVKWTGHADPTPVPRAQLLLDSNNPALLREIDEAVERYKEEKRLDEDDEDEPDACPTSNNDPIVLGPEPSGREARVRRPPVRYNPGGVNYLTYVDDLHEMILATYGGMPSYFNDYEMTEF